MKRLLRLYRDLWQQLYHIALTAGLTGWDLIRARLAEVGNKISANSVDQQLSLSHLHAGEAALPRVKVFRTVLRLFGLKSDKQSSLRLYASLVTTKTAARLWATKQTIKILTLLYASEFWSTLSTAGSRIKSSLVGHIAVFYSRIFVGTVSVAKSIFKSLSFALTRMADAKSSLSRVRTQQASHLRGRPILGHATLVSSRMTENAHMFVQLISYISAPLVIRSATKSYFNGRAIVGHVVSSIAALKQTITTAVSITTDKARNFVGKAEGLILAAAHAIIGTVTALSASMRSFVYAICRLRVAPISRFRGLAVWRAFIGQSRATTGQAQRAISESRLAQMLSNTAAPADQPLKIAVQAAQRLISTLRGLTTASVSRAAGVSTGTMAYISASISNTTASTGAAFSHTASSSRCILSVLSTADWIYPRQSGTELYIWQVADAVQNGETLKLT